MNNQQAAFTTCYGPINPIVMQKAKNVKLLICDADGVMSNGIIYQGNAGEELKGFHVRDGYGINCLLISKIEVAVITGRESQLLKDRCATLGVKHLYQGCSNKIKPFHLLLEKLQIRETQVAYIGDDVLDWPVMTVVGLSIAVSNAHPILLPRVDYVTRLAGGDGAIREICDLILMSQGNFTPDSLCS
ncbi:3-deoxy-D-manno-octulosonate 8-phosphate phosphatase KdsC [Candidatus Erwinia haradaeae]|uniref:3-deoxy-D-manno-octulosonate 8-phosphate phosphatase KdsC n=1 Tax=Candidatus Erwinia haradaeae TaxID=1922217 RepID=A0A451DDK0_9GAMM|nr:3-deoxy-manno-octulosonate-8-phosphatase KdsC [Candidatus Erwinia haradaeae]VFP84563.1 3-deoxy-D-manno-octulosonate 8-phosphate phosphatase KdsC [Candidatus Erwinia haradaeae]